MVSHTTLFQVATAGFLAFGCFGSDFPIDRFGAKPDGSKCTAAFAAAFGAAADAGGGRVVVPKGRWFTGAIRLKSNCELHLECGAEVVFSDDLEDYLPGVPTSFEGVECVNVSPLVYAYGCTNVAVTGKGALRVKMGFWWSWAGRRKPACEAANRVLKDEWAPRRTPVEERQLWKLPGAEFRPPFLHFNRCAGVRLDGFAVRGTPFWTIHLFLCDGVAIRGLDVDAADGDGRMINNSDGIDIEMSRNVDIANCTFRQGDDAVVVKSGRDFDGRRLSTPTENVVVSGCVVRAAHNLLAVGSELAGGIRNVRVRDCRIVGPAEEVLFVKTNPRRGGFVENVVVEDVSACELRAAGERRGSVFAIDAMYWYGAPGEEPLEREYLTDIRGLTVRRVHARSAVRRLDLRGDGRRPPRDILIEDVSVDSCDEPDRLENVRIRRQ